MVQPEGQGNDPSGDYDVTKHLEFIQTVIERLARTSFILKGWSVTLVAAVFLLAVRGANPHLALLAGLLSGITFWGLDAFYLREERKYRKLYDHIRKNGSKGEDRYTLDAGPYASQVDGWLKTMVTPTVGIFYAVVVAVVVMGLAFFEVKGC